MSGRVDRLLATQFVHLLLCERREAGGGAGRGRGQTLANINIRLFIIQLPRIHTGPSPDSQLGALLSGQALLFNAEDELFSFREVLRKTRGKANIQMIYNLETRGAAGGCRHLTQFLQTDFIICYRVLIAKGYPAFTQLSAAE